LRSRCGRDERRQRWTGKQIAASLEAAEPIWRY
jgi:hypothetical protein